MTLYRKLFYCNSLRCFLMRFFARFIIILSLLLILISLNFMNI